MQPMGMGGASGTIPDSIAAQFDETMEILADTAPVNVGADSFSVDTQCKYTLYLFICMCLFAISVSIYARVCCVYS